MKTLDDIKDGDLDEACHLAASALASNANNDGVRGQIDFLRTVAGMTTREIIEASIDESGE